MLTTELLLLLSIDFIGIGIGLFSIYTVQKTKKELGGKVGNALTLFVWGVLFMIAAFSITVIFSRLKLLAPLPLDIHHLFMAVGMLFFVVAAKKFASLAKL